MSEEEYKFIIGGLIEYICNHTDFWDWHEEIDELFPTAIDWAEKFDNSLKETPLPPKTPCTCPYEWAKDRMKTVEDFLHAWKVKDTEDSE